MTPKTPSLDASVKRWLAALGLACVLAVAFLAHSFWTAFRPVPEEIAITDQPAHEEEQHRPVIHQPEWTRPQPVRVVKEEQPTTSLFATDNNPEALRKKQEAAAKEIASKQAEHLRHLIVKGKLPDGLGNLTIEQVNQMEKDGIVIE